MIFLADPDLAIASPLPYLFDEESHRDRQAREALFCTFNADLGYFERTVLGVTQSTGARVTVVGDGRISDPDPRAARNAGTRYVHGLAVTGSGAAFHPKVTVVAGPERAMVAVGSGNLSSGGWHLNKEIWTVATANPERCPAMVAECAAWLRTLGQVCAITPHAVQGIGRTVTLLEQLAAAATVVDTGHHLVHTSSISLLDQLPADDVAHLVLYAPFHDEKAAAIRRLVERLRPGRVTLAVQSGRRTVIQPDAVRYVIADLGMRFDVVEDATEKYRHGKLIEATDADGSRWTLTGSPNLSARALLLSAAQGGNIEVGVISWPSASLFPSETRPITLDEVPAVRIADPPADRAASNATLLAAIRTDEGLELVFARPPTAEVGVLAWSAADTDRWTEVGTVPAGAAAHVLTDVNLPGGTPVRCVHGTGADSFPGNTIFITDPAMVLTRPGEHLPRGRTSSPGRPRSSLILGYWSCGYPRSASLPLRARAAPCGVSQLPPYPAVRARTTRPAAGFGSIQMRKSGWPTPMRPRLTSGQPCSISPWAAFLDCVLSQERPTAACGNQRTGSSMRPGLGSTRTTRAPSATTLTRAAQPGWPTARTAAMSPTGPRTVA